MTTEIGFITGTVNSKIPLDADKIFVLLRDVPRLPGSRISQFEPSEQVAGMDSLYNREQLSLPNSLMAILIMTVLCGPIRAQFSYGFANSMAREASSIIGFGITTVDGWDQVVVLAVDPNGSAAQAGIQVGDVLTSCGNVPLLSSVELEDIIGLLKQGDQIELTIERLDAEARVIIEFNQDLVSLLAHDSPINKTNEPTHVPFTNALPESDIFKGEPNTAVLPSRFPGQPGVQMELLDNLLSTIKNQEAIIAELRKEIEELRTQLNLPAKVMQF